MRLLLVSRADLFSKRGGDTLQMEKTAEALSDLGLQVSIATIGDLAHSLNVDLVHFFNIDRPYEALFAARWAETRGLPYFLSPIHHSHLHVAHMRRNDARVSAVIPERLRSFLVALRVAVALRPVSHGLSFLSFCLWNFWSFRRRVRGMLECYPLALLADGELENLRRDYGLVGEISSVVAPNGIPEASGASFEFEEVAPSIVVVGRIEQRKRQLEILDAADRTGVSVTFIGAANANQRRYGDEFMSRVAKSPYSRWFGSLDHGELMRMLRGPGVLINASHVEVQSLVDIEAAVGGRWIISLDNGGASQEHLGPVVRLAQSLEEAVLLASELSMSAPPACVYSHTWRDTGVKLMTLYESVRH